MRKVLGDVTQSQLNTRATTTPGKKTLGKSTISQESFQESFKPESNKLEREIIELFETQVEELEKEVEDLTNANVSYGEVIEHLTTQNNELLEFIAVLENGQEVTEELDQLQRQQIALDRKTIYDLNITIKSMQRQLQEKDKRIEEIKLINQSLQTLTVPTTSSSTSTTPPPSDSSEAIPITTNPTQELYRSIEHEQQLQQLQQQLQQQHNHHQLQQLQLQQLLQQQHHHQQLQHLQQLQQQQQYKDLLLQFEIKEEECQILQNRCEELLNNNIINNNNNKKVLKSTATNTNTNFNTNTNTNTNTETNVTGGKGGGLLTLDPELQALLNTTTTTTTVNTNRTNENTPYPFNHQAVYDQLLAHISYWRNLATSHNILHLRALDFDFQSPPTTTSTTTTATTLQYRRRHSIVPLPPVILPSAPITTPRVNANGRTFYHTVTTPLVELQIPQSSPSFHRDVLHLQHRIQTQRIAHATLPTIFATDTDTNTNRQQHTAPTTKALLQYEGQGVTSVAFKGKEKYLLNDHRDLFYKLLTPLTIE